MSSHAVRLAEPSRGRRVPVRWAVLAGVVAGLIALAVMSVLEGAEPFDPDTIVPVERYEEIGKRYPQVGFDVLAGFDYGAPPDAEPAKPISDVIPANIQQLDGQRVGVVGFMLPVDFNGQGVTEFILNASYDMCYFGAPTTPNQFIVVKMKDRRRTRFVHTPVAVLGTLRVRPERRDGRLVSLYEIEADGIAVGAGR